MKNNLKVLRNIIAISILILNSSKIFATSVNFSVTATVQPYCSIAATNLSFDPYTSQNNSDKTSVVTVTCTAGTGYHVKLDSGQNSSSTSTRKMKGAASASNLLQYFLYSDSARTVIWGNNANNSDSPPGAGTGLAQTYTVYGRIPSGQTTVPVDNYSDQIAVSITIP